MTASHTHTHTQAPNTHPNTHIRGRKALKQRAGKQIEWNRGANAEIGKGVHKRKIKREKGK